MKRRALLGGLAAALAIPRRLNAQASPRVHRVGLVFTSSPVAEMAGANPAHPLVRVFIHTLRDSGYVEPLSVVVERRSVGGHLDQFSSILAELLPRSLFVPADQVIE